MSQPTLLASIIAGEASGIEPQQAVLNVIQNRAAVNFGSYGPTWIAQATAPEQFSAYPNALGKPTSDTYSMIAAAIDGTLGNIVPKALNYANPHLTNSEWVKQAYATGQGVDIGGNVFWANDKGGSPGFDVSKIWSPTSTTLTPTPTPTPALPTFPTFPTFPTLPISSTGLFTNIDDVVKFLNAFTPLLVNNTTATALAPLLVQVLIKILPLL